jgi:dipeptidyl aminopeptidase/acylaminoacyl peptidase
LALAIKMKTIISLLIVIILATYVHAQDERYDKLHLWGASNMQWFSNSISPDGSARVDQVYFNKTTASSVGIISTTDNKVLHIIDATPDHKHTDILWSPDGKYIAIHDSSSKHSRLMVYGKEYASYQQVIIPDLKAIALRELSLKDSDIKSSGQIPLNWIGTSSR